MRDPSSAAVTAAAGAEIPEKRCSNRASLSALTRSAADRWLKAAQHLHLSPHGEENGTFLGLSCFCLLSASRGVTLA